MVRGDYPISWYARHHAILYAAETDTNAHTCTLATYLPPNTKAILIEITRTSGSDTISVYPNSDADACLVTDQQLFLLRVNGAEIKYAQETASDEFTICCFGAIIEGEIKK